MRCYIQNKNIIDNSIDFPNKCLENNLKHFEIDEGAVLGENFGEVLDSGTIMISNQTEPIEIESCDRIKLQDINQTISDKWMCVDTFQEIMINNNPAIYNYVITLCSETKGLEFYYCPNLKITPNKLKRSIAYYLELYLKSYGGVIRTNSGIHPKYGFDSETLTFFDTIEAPEKQWNVPNLREVFTDLMMIADKIPIVQNGIISAMDLTETTTKIDDYSNILKVNKSQSLEDYVSEIQMNMVNVMQTQIKDTDNSTTRIDYIPLECDGYYITSENFKIKTQDPILRINHLWFCFWHTSSSGTVRLIKTDLTAMPQWNILGQLQPTTYNFVKEAKEYQTLPILRYTTIAGTDVKNKYKNYNIYYTRYSNEISGMSEETSNIFGFVTYPLREFKAMAMDKIGMQITPENNEPNIYYSSYFIVEYETTVDAMFRAGKENAGTNDRTIIDNQSYSFVDAYSQGTLEYQKANRLGNPQVIISQRYVNGDANPPIKIKQRYKDNIIIHQVEYSIYKEYIDVQAIGSKDFVLMDYYTGIKSKVRSWKNAQDDALIRNELAKFYVEVSNENHENISGNDTITIQSYEFKAENLALYMGRSFYPEAYMGQAFPYVPALVDGETLEAKSINYAFIRTATKDYQSDDYTFMSPDNIESENNTYYALDTTTRFFGDSCGVSCGFKDNAIVGKYAPFNENFVKYVNTGSSLGYQSPHYVDATYTGGIPLQDYYYVDENYEINEYTIKYYANVEYPLLSASQTGAGDWQQVDESSTYIKSGFTDAGIKRVFGLNMAKPLVKTSDICSNDYCPIILKRKNFLLDNSEILRQNLQMEWVQDGGIVLKDLWKKQMPIANTKIIKPQWLYVLRGDEKLTDKITMSVAEKWRLTTGPTGNIGATSITDLSAEIVVSVPAVDVDSEYTYAITDANDNVFMYFRKGYNGWQGTELHFFINIRGIKSHNIYNDNFVKIGEI